MSFLENELGFELQTDDYLVFFGKHNSTLQNVRKAYPHLDWAWVKQVHGDILLKSENSISCDREADAHWCELLKLGLIVRTADCIPIMAYNSEKKFALSIHAGWRGVANKISSKSLKKLQNHAPLEGWKFFVGPHVLQKSFEIKDDAYQILKNSTTLPDVEWLQKTELGYKANLNVILASQLKEVGIKQSQLNFLEIDTVTDMRFHSYRRDKEISGRQISFIALM